MPKPAHSHAQRSLQSVCAVGRHLRRYPVGGVACSAPGTCKQLTPQITAICGGVRRCRQLTSTSCLGACSGPYVEYTYQQVPPPLRPPAVGRGDDQNHARGARRGGRARRRAARTLRAERAGGREDPRGRRVVTLLLLLLLLLLIL